jgi:hypothetical protein
VGRAVGQAVTLRLSTPAARVRARVTSCGYCGGQCGTGTRFLRVLPFPLPSIPLTVPYSSSCVTRDWYSGRRTDWTPSQPSQYVALYYAKGAPMNDVPAVLLGSRSGLSVRVGTGSYCQWTYFFFLYLNPG